MPREPLALGLTFALACVSACLFLMLRSEGKGRMSARAAAGGPSR